MNRNEYEQVSPEVILRTTRWANEKLRRARKAAYRDGLNAGLHASSPGVFPGMRHIFPADEQEHWLDGWKDGMAKR